MQKHNKAFITNQCKAQYIATHWNYKQKKKKDIVHYYNNAPVPFPKQ